MRAARLVFEVVAELKNQRVEYAELTTIFAANIASLGGVQQIVQTFTQRSGAVAPAGTTSRRPPGPTRVDPETTAGPRPRNEPETNDMANKPPSGSKRPGSPGPTPTERESGPMRSHGGTASAGGGDRGESDRLTVPTGRTLSVHEAAIANKLVAEGHTVEALPESNVRTADFLVDGARTELKSISNITSADPSGALARRILEGAGQAPNIIVDLRQQSGMTLELAQRAVRRAYGADGGRLENVRLIGPDFDVNVPRVGGGEPSPSAP